MLFFASAKSMPRSDHSLWMLGLPTATRDCQAVPLFAARICRRHIYMERFFEDSRNLNSVVVVLWTYHSDKMCKRCGMRKETREQHEPDFVAWTSSKHLEGRGIEIYWAQLVNVAWFGRNKQYNSSFQYEQSKDALTSCEFVEFVRHFNLVSCDFSCRMCSICTERTS